MPKIIDLVGKRFGKLVVLKRNGVDPKSHKIIWLCKCDCGNEIEAQGRWLRFGRTTSCGCDRHGLKHPRAIDLTGVRFNSITVIRLHKRDEKTRKYFWECVCDCGNKIIVRANDLLSGRQKSCGCKKSQFIGVKNKIHGDSIGGEYARLYRTWANMLDRCCNKNNKSYKWYGAKGVKVYSLWNEYIPFKEWALSSGWDKTLTIDRIDVDGDYSPSNCRWVPFSMQANNKTNSFLYDFYSSKINNKLLAEKLGVSETSLYYRARKYGKECAINWAVDECGKKLCELWGKVLPSM